MPACLNYLIDPFFIFHARYAERIQFSGYDRYQNAGLINSFLSDPHKKIDTIIVGTSMSENLPVSTFKNKYGVNALKLTLSGGRPREVNTVVEHAIRTGSVDKVIWEIHRAYEFSDHLLQHIKSPLPLFLYNKNRLDEWRYIFNSDVLNYSKKVIQKKLKGRSELESLYTWQSVKKFKFFSSPENIEKLIKVVEDADHPVASLDDIVGDYDFPNLEYNLLQTLKSNPNVEFILFFPPISYYAHVKNGRELFIKQLLMRKKLLEEVSSLDHVSVHGFDLQYNLSENLENFRDPSHYSPEISKGLAESMLTQKSLITIDQWAPYNSEFINRIQDFREAMLSK